LFSDIYLGQKIKIVFGLGRCFVIFERLNVLIINCLKVYFVCCDVIDLDSTI